MKKFYLFLLFFFSAFSVFGQEILFEDRFEGNLKSGWIWLRENGSGHRFNNNALEIQVDTTNDENNVRNTLVRTTDFVGKGSVSIETELTCDPAPCNQFQQGGLCWIRGGRVIFKLVHELVDGRMYIFPGKIPVDTPVVRLRITTGSNDDLVAEYSGSGDSGYRKIYEGKLNVNKADQIGLQCWNGPSSNNHWMRVRFFKITRKSE